MNMIKRILIAGGCALVLAGCGSTVKLDEPTPAPVEERGAGTPGAAGRSGPGGAAGAGAAGVGTGSADGRQLGQQGAGAVDPLNDPSSPLARRSIYFDFDSYTVRDEYRGTIEAHARYLISNQGRRLVIQGNADERGSREYNLALGQKRSEAVRKALSALGVNEAQIEAVSFGEEKPRATGADEASYAENRRADLVYQ